MASDKKTRRWNRIPIKFLDSERESETPRNHGYSANDHISVDDSEDLMPEFEETDDDRPPQVSIEPLVDAPQHTEAGGPAVAELVATRAELKRIEAEGSELRDRLARRQADFENYRK